MVFNNRIEKKETWKWDKRIIEEVKNFKYSGFTFSKNGKYRTHQGIRQKKKIGGE